MPLTFATFEMDVSSEALERMRVVDPGYDRGPSKDVLKFMFATARRFHPECRLVLLTDEHTQFLDLPEDVEVHRYPLDVNTLAMNSMIAQLGFLRESQEPSHVVFLDTDILIKGDLSHIFTKKFDIGFTYRSHEMPINVGVIFVHANGYRGARVFMERILELIEDKYAAYKPRHCCQLAIKEALNNPSNLTTEQIIVVHDWGMRILLVPCLIYNFTTWPSDVMDHEYPDQLVLHFKGDRKDLMIPYYEKYMKRW